MLRTTLALAALSAASPAWAIDSDGTRPDPALTPGAVRTTSTAEICDKTRHTADVRNVSGAEKQAVYHRYGLASNRAGWCNSEEGCEIDHLVSLELGGSNDIANLWPQPYAGEWNAHAKDALENRLHKLVCAGRLDIVTAQTAIRTDWIAAYKQYVGPAPAE